MELCALNPNCSSLSREVLRSAHRGLARASLRSHPIPIAPVDVEEGVSRSFWHEKSQKITNHEVDPPEDDVVVDPGAK